MMTGSRRDFVAQIGRGGIALVGVSLASSFTSSPLVAQDGSAQSAASNVEMTADSYKPVRRAPKPSAAATMTDKELETFERNLACPCPCTLDVYTCRTTDFNCGISPAVHGDIKALVDGGYSGAEIMAAMTDTYGDFILMTPRKQGFNLLAWFAPFAALGIGAVAIGVMLRGWRINAAKGNMERATLALVAAHSPHDAATDPDATPDELARLQAALRNDGQ